jgi:hypothetical protein
MVWRETVHFSQARSMLMPIERGATFRTMKFIRLAERRAASEMTGKTFRPQGD